MHLKAYYCKGCSICFIIPCVFEFKNNTALQSYFKLTKLFMEHTNDSLLRPHVYNVIATEISSVPPIGICRRHEPNPAGLVNLPTFD